MKGPPPRAKHKRSERIDLNKQEKHESKRIKSDKACANQNQHETKKKEMEPKNTSNPPIRGDRPLERGLQQRVIQPQVGCQGEVEGHQLVNQQAERPERPAVHQVVRVGLVEPSEHLLRVVL